jgi:hypothetical protein
MQQPDRGEVEAAAPPVQPHRRREPDQPGRPVDAHGGPEVQLDVVGRDQEPIMQN